MENRKVRLNQHTNLLELEEHMYPLVDVDTPNVFQMCIRDRHIPAIAHEIGMDFEIDFANPISEKTPNLCHLAPAGHTYMEDLNEAGGVYAVMNELNKKGLLHTECMTVTGKTLGENIEGCVNKNPEVIRPIDNPYSETGGLAVLKGNPVSYTHLDVYKRQVWEHRL